MEIESTIALIAEIINSTPHSATSVAGSKIQQIIVVSFRIVHAEGRIGKLYKQHNLTIGTRGVPILTWSRKRTCKSPCTFVKTHTRTTLKTLLSAGSDDCQRHER